MTVKLNIYIDSNFKTVSNNSNLISKCNSKQKLNIDINTNNTTNNNLASNEDKSITMNSPGLIDSSRNKIHVNLKLIVKFSC